ncbi:MAG: Uma2 family endonuclease [Chloroflexota bacterium]|nr:Uma2 family endonuclease [Chloroflexota bacterium]
MVTNIRHLTVEEYLAFDDASEIRNEYIDGELIPMPGGSNHHSVIIAYAIVALANALGEKDCIIRSSDMRVCIDETKYVYPDVSVVCGEAIFADENETILLNPTVVVEVTSPSSIERDHVDKLSLYGAVPSIQCYLILDQTRVFAECYSRAEGGWRLRQYASLDDVISLEPLACSLALAEVYRRIVFED